ncbi:MAG: hypothetical protein ACLULH_10790 [Bacteroides fragilis]
MFGEFILDNLDSGFRDLTFPAGKQDFAVFISGAPYALRIAAERVEAPESSFSEAYPSAASAFVLLPSFISCE